MHAATVTRVLGLALLTSSVLSLAQEDAVVKAEPADRVYSPYANKDFPTALLFGDVHVHTGLSADAGGAGTRLMPRDAYRFARGEQVISNTGQQVKLQQPYDFFAVTDHTDGMGVITDILAGAPNIMADPYGRELNAAFNKGGKVASDAVIGMIAKFSQGELSQALNYQPGNPAYRSTWERIVSAGEEFNEPGVFTTLFGFEWTSLVKGNNLHRIVLMRDGTDRALQVVPYTTTKPTGSTDPRDLWAWMQNWEKTTGGDILAIPHNGNLSNGWMFSLTDNFDGNKPLDAEYAATRARWEPIMEVTQMKGDGETHPLLSPEDEFSNFETWDLGNLDLSEKKTPAMLPGEYARSALKRGLELDSSLGVNPYKFGMIGSTDTHTGLSTIDEDNFFSKFPSNEPRPVRATHESKGNTELGLARQGWKYASQGAVAVWARKNTREAIFDAMENKEVYATTGPRIRVRFFGGYDFVEEDIKHRDPAFIGYGKGVPMGSDLNRAPEARSPTFLVYALRDPLGANLDRIQVVKGWIDEDGIAQEKVYDVAWSGERKASADGRVPAVGSTVDLAQASWTNTIGAPELGTVWADPEFNPEQKAFYYARVIVIPTPRWTAYDQARFGMELPKHIPLTIQERAYTSPIWYAP